jgi:hypothetical protein
MRYTGIRVGSPSVLRYIPTRVQAPEQNRISPPAHEGSSAPRRNRTRTNKIQAAAKRRSESRDGDGGDGRLAALGAAGGRLQGGGGGEGEWRGRGAGAVLQAAHPRRGPRAPAEDQRPPPPGGPAQRPQLPRYRRAPVPPNPKPSSLTL